MYRDDDHGIITRDPETGLIRAILLHYPAEVKTSPPPAYMDRQAAINLAAVGSTAKKSLVIDGLEPFTPFRVERLVPSGRGDAESVWRHLGEPDTLSREAAREVSRFAEILDSTQVNGDEEGNLVCAEELLPWTLIALTQLKGTSR